MAQNGRNGNCEYAQDCALQAMTIEEIISSLFYVDTNGCYHINTVLTLGDCDNLTPAATCGNNESWIDLFKKAVIKDDCGNWALSIFYATPE